MSTVKTLMIGVAVGAAFGILFAPAKGSKTRRRIARKGNAIRESWCEFKDTLSGAIQNIKEEVSDVTDKATMEGERWPATEEQLRTT